MRKPFHGDNAASIHLCHGRDAGIDREEVLIPTLSTKGSKHTACAAITFCTHNFGAGQTPTFAEPLGEHEEGIITIDANFLTVDEEANVVTNFCHTLIHIWQVTFGAVGISGTSK